MSFFSQYIIFLFGGKSPVNVTRKDVEHQGGVGYLILPVLFGYLLICRVKATHLHETYLCMFN